MFVASRWDKGIRENVSGPILLRAAQLFRSVGDDFFLAVDLLGEDISNGSEGRVGLDDEGLGEIGIAHNIVGSQVVPQSFEGMLVGICPLPSYIFLGEFRTKGIDGDDDCPAVGFKLMQ